MKFLFSPENVIHVLEVLCVAFPPVTVNPPPPWVEKCVKSLFTCSLKYSVDV